MQSYISLLRVRISTLDRTLRSFQATLLIVCFSLTGCNAEEPSNSMDTTSVQLNNFFEALAAQNEFSGAVLLAQEGEIVFEKYLGYADINDKTKTISPNSSFRIGSLCKQITAMAIMMLQERGILDYDDEIRKYLPSLPYEGITIRHLLHHTSGVPDYTNSFYKQWSANEDIADSKLPLNKDLIEQLSTTKQEVLFEPGEKYEYSNVGYVMLAQIVEKVAEMPINQFLQDNIFTPLEMKNTKVFVPGIEFTVAERVYGFEYLADGIAHDENDWFFANAMIGASGIYSSAQDLLKWDQAWYSNELVLQATIADAYISGETNEGEKTRYGFGLNLEEDETGNVTDVEHSGLLAGFRTYLYRNLQAKFTVIILTNSSAKEQEIDVIREGLSRIFSDDEWTIPPKKVNYELAAIIESDGINAAIRRFDEIRKIEDNNYLIEDELINRLSALYRKKGQDHVASKLEDLVGLH